MWCDEHLSICLRQRVGNRRPGICRDIMHLRSYLVYTTAQAVVCHGYTTSRYRQVALSNQVPPRSSKYRYLNLRLSVCYQGKRRIRMYVCIYMDLTDVHHLIIIATGALGRFLLLLGEGRKQDKSRHPVSPRTTQAHTLDPHSRAVSVMSVMKTTAFVRAP
ncbi:uncharacterized protein LY79DRAFT_563325 [Colletotrichum navitas]|uniref:Uncharacterized protein n=1 Tax=Colletotrichum navitas TaxID=681940 RepID=A0AAD8PT60_9PEZI|nr:uncharacterized protein LY79DRAFT_563325 [Colletotrichum navitas]KAK1579750.1 hypothetical protein LY79DRAFT_563325 [Colletotrichum navitas]